MKTNYLVGYNPAPVTGQVEVASAPQVVYAEVMQK
jgi:hypothetical protein